MENRKGEDNKVSRRIWEAVETKTGETGVAKAERRRYDMIRRRKEKNKREGERRKKLKETKMMDVKKVAKEWEI